MDDHGFDTDAPISALERLMQAIAIIGLAIIATLVVMSR
jgi:hypothetical protein